IPVERSSQRCRSQDPARLLSDRLADRDPSAPGWRLRRRSAGSLCAFRDGRCLQYRKRVMATAPIATPSPDELAIAAPGLNPGASAGRSPTLLRAAFGQDEANHGTVRYSVGNEGLVRVPFEAVGPLTTVGGFVLAKAGDDAIAIGALKLHHED